MDTLKFKRNGVRVIAHRGLSGIETENTNSAFVAAANRSYYGIETDVHVTADDNFVLLHDDTTERVADEVINVEQSLYKQIRELRLRNICRYDTEEKFKDDIREDIIIPSLDEYISICRKYNKKCVLEIKNDFEKRHLEMLVQRLDALEYLENMIFISFQWDNLIKLREICPQASIQMLMNKYDDSVLEIMDKYSFDLDVWDRYLTKDIIDKVHSHGHKVNCWTVDNIEDAERLADWGVDYITSNILE